MSGCDGSWPDISLAWSPDGTELATLLRWSVWIVGADGSDPHPLSLDAFEHRWGHPFAIAWRPVR
jgi:hypothetical protein